MENGKVKELYNEAKNKAKDVIGSIEEKAKAATEEISKQAVEFVDENGNGKIDLVDFVIKALRTKGVNINRAEYLETAFKKYCDEETIKKAIDETPAKADISKEIVDKAATETIGLHKALVVTGSVGLGYVPGGVGVDIATTVADLAQYYAQLLIIMQKLMYLYGYPELELQKENGSIDDGTMNLIIIGLGAMAGVKEAAVFIEKITEKLATNAPKIILKPGFSTKIAYRVSKKVLKFFGIKLTKEIASKGISNAIKFAGGAIMGGLSFVTFSSACKNFHTAIKDTPLSDPHYICESNVVDVEVITKELEEELESEIQIDDEEKETE